MWCWDSSRAVIEGRRNPEIEAIKKSEMFLKLLPKTRTMEDRNIFDVWSILISRI